MTRRFADFSRPHKHCTIGDVLAIVIAAAFVTIAFVSVLVLVATMARPAHARWKSEYAAAPQAVQDWYQNAELTEAAKKRFSFTKCCAKADVVDTKFKVGGAGNDEWWWLNSGQWQRVPDDIIHWGEHAPGGRPTLFVYDGRPTCFFPGEDGN